MQLNQLRAARTGMLLLLLLVLGPPAVVQAQSMFELTYVTNSGSITITGFTGPNWLDVSVVIGETINGWPVTEIGPWAFMDSGIRSVTIPKSVTAISTGAFGEDGLLTAITVDTNNPAYSSLDGVLFDKSQDELVQFPAGLSGSYAIPSSVHSIGNYAFSGCSSLTSVTIPNGVTSIGAGAFVNCSSLTSVTIPSSVQGIGNYAFENCTSLTRVYFKGVAPGLGSPGLSSYVFFADPVTAYFLPGLNDMGGFS